MQVSSSFVPTYLKAQSPDDLRLMLVRLNAVSGRYIKYTIVKSGKDWYAWFDWDCLEEIPDVGGK